MPRNLYQSMGEVGSPHPAGPETVLACAKILTPAPFPRAGAMTPRQLPQFGSWGTIICPAERISIIVPMLNEAQSIARTLASLAALRRDGHEVIVVDGASADHSVATARPLADVVMTSARGRALQMNAGARAATGDIFLFLHADTLLPGTAAAQIIGALRPQAQGWGRFDVRFTTSSPLLRLVAWFMNLRSRVTGIATGDQAIFMKRDWFEAVGGFPAIPLMEDIAMSRKLRRLGRPACLRTPVTTSSRRWERNGVVRTIFEMWALRLLYFVGVAPDLLAAHYRRTRPDA